MSLKDENLYYVGGVVRDELLGVKSFDTDYCYEGNAIEFARSKGLNIIKENPAFGTVRVLYNDGEIDIASTRVETYPEAGKLPKVEKIGCSLKEDVKRRDFTINSLYKRTTDGEIIDFVEGVNDIKIRRIRVLHDKSFIEDPTRILRALKFSVRFGFELNEETKKLQEEYLEDINYDMSFHRLKKELTETFNLNKFEAYEKFVNQKIYMLLGENQVPQKFYASIEKYSFTPMWLKYLGLYDLGNLELTRFEKRILEWTKRLNKEKPNNNTPRESILLHQIWEGCRIDI